MAIDGHCGFHTRIDTGNIFLPNWNNVLAYPIRIDNPSPKVTICTMPAGRASRNQSQTPMDGFLGGSDYCGAGQEVLIPWTIKCTFNIVGP